MEEWEEHMRNFNPEELITFELVPKVMEVIFYFKGIRNFYRTTNNYKRSLFRFIFLKSKSEFISSRSRKQISSLKIKS